MLLTKKQTKKQTKKEIEQNNTPSPYREWGKNLENPANIRTNISSNFAPVSAIASSERVVAI